MFERIQIALSDAVIRQAVADALDDVAREGMALDPMPGQVSHQEQARAALERVEPSIGLIILDLDLPPRARCRQERHGAVALVEELKDRNPQPAVLIVTDENSALVRHLGKGIDRFDVLLMRRANDDIFDQLRGALLRWREQASPRVRQMEPQRPLASLDLYPRDASVRYEIRLFSPGNAPVLESDEILVRHGLAFRQLLEEIEYFDHTEQDWFRGLRTRGRQLFDMIFADGCRDAYERAIGHCGGLERVHIRFHLDRSHYATPFEAVFDASKEGRGFLMTLVPMARRVQTADRHLKLRPFDLSRRDQVRALLILSDVGETHHVDTEPGLDPPTFATLKNLALERDHLLELEGADARLHLQLLEAEDGENPRAFKDRIEAVLTDGRRWDVVHFAGHSWFTMGPHEQRGFLVLRRNRFAADLLPVAEFARWLRGARTQLAYLSSCQSSSAAMAYELAENGVPGTLGFRWDVSDDKAAIFARSFYEEAFKSGVTVAEAFRLARWKMYEAQDRFFPAPMLVLQPDDWVGVAAA